MKNEKLKIKNYNSKFKIKYLLSLICIFALLSLFFYLFKFNFFKEKKSSPLEPKLTKITLAMGYIPNVQFAPFYVALDKGYFAQKGLEIEFNYGWETDIIALLANNKLQFGIGSGDQIILAVSQDLPVVYIFNWYQKFPITITSLTDKNIKKPSDLINKKVGIPAVYGASYIGLKAFLSINNISEKQIKLETIGYTQVPSLTESKVDAAVCYAMNEPVQLEGSGHPTNNIHVADYVNLVSNGLITNKKTIKDNPQLVQSLVVAFTKGLRDTINNPDEAFEISKKFIPELNKENESLQREVLQESIYHWLVPHPMKMAPRYGWNKKEQWQDSVNLMKKFGLIKKIPPVESLFTNQFIE